MSWETHEAAKRIADGWHSELEEVRERNAVLGRENAKLRELMRDMWDWLAPTATNTGAPLKELHSRMIELGVTEDR